MNQAITLNWKGVGVSDILPNINEKGVTISNTLGAIKREPKGGSR